jgi:uncharacterized damage-inducible protein DinB
MSVGLVQSYRAFAYNNAWANHRLLGACAELSHRMRLSTIYQEHASSRRNSMSSFPIAEARH